MVQALSAPVARITHAEVVSLVRAVPDALLYASSEHVQWQRFLVSCILQSHVAV